MLDSAADFPLLSYLQQKLRIKCRFIGDTLRENPHSVELIYEVVWDGVILCVIILWSLTRECDWICIISWMYVIVYSFNIETVALLLSRTPNTFSTNTYSKNNIFCKVKLNSLIYGLCCDIITLGCNKLTIWPEICVSWKTLSLISVYQYDLWQEMGLGSFENLLCILIAECCMFSIINVMMCVLP